MVPRHRSFTLCEKKAAVSGAGDSNNCKTVGRFSISEKLITKRRKVKGFQLNCFCFAVIKILFLTNNWVS